MEVFSGWPLFHFDIVVSTASVHNGLRRTKVEKNTFFLGLSKGGRVSRFKVATEIRAKVGKRGKESKTFKG